MRCWLAVVLALGGCYEVGDVRTSDPDSGSAGTDSTGGNGGSAASGGWAATGGANDASADATLDAPFDAPPDTPTEIGNWAFCKDLGYAGECVGTTTVIYSLGPNSCGKTPTGTCVINECAKIGAQCGADSCSSGVACDPALPPGEEDLCYNWGNDGKCVDNVAIQQVGSTTDCRYKDCTALGATCIDSASAAADCF